MKKKIIFLIHTLAGGGAEKALVNLVNNMDSNKYDITVMTVVDTGMYIEQLNSDIKYKSIIKIPKKFKTNKSGSLLSSKREKGSKLIKIYSNFWKYFPIKLIHKIFIGNKYDYEVSFLEGICAKIIASSTNKKSKKYVWIHVDLINQHKSKNVFKSFEEEKNIYKKFDNIICVSNSVKNKFLELFGDFNNMIVKYNPIDSKEILTKSNLVSEDKIEKTRFTIVSVGRLNAQKSYIRLLKSFHRLIQDGRELELWIIGDGTDFSNLKEYIDKNNLNDRIKLLGFKKNPYYYMSLADLFVCSSIAEGFSTVATEATILGLPIVTTDCSGMKELLGDSEYGIVTENNEEALYEGMKKIVDSEETYKIYKELSIERGKNFDLGELTSEIEELFN